MVRLFFVNCRYGRLLLFFSKIGRCFVNKRSTIRSLKVKQYYCLIMVRWDSRTVDLRCEIWHFILTGTVAILNSF